MKHRVEANEPKPFMIALSTVSDRLHHTAQISELTDAIILHYAPFQIGPASISADTSSSAAVRQHTPVPGC